MPPNKMKKASFKNPKRPHNNSSRNSFESGFEDRAAVHQNQFRSGHKNRSVNFKKSSFKAERTGGIKHVTGIRNLLGEDESMSAGPSQSGHNRFRDNPSRSNRVSNFNKSRNRHAPTGRFLAVSESKWYRVSVIGGQKLTKEFVLESLRGFFPPTMTFTPVIYKNVRDDAVFFVNDHDVAKKLLDCNRRITLPDESRVEITVRPGVPPVDINEEFKERIKFAMQKRYVQETNALDLSNFHMDPDLCNDVWCPLNRPIVLMTVLEIVHEHLPNLRALNLDSNNFRFIDKLDILAIKFRDLKILYLGDNQLRDINTLNVLKNLQLEELKLEGNGLCNKYKSRQEDYIKEVRKKIPKLLRLDGIELPPPISFDVEDDKRRLPVTQKMFTADPGAHEIAGKFLQQYFTIFDSEKREPLLEAYHENAVFSLTTTITQGSHKFSSFLGDSRNLLRVPDSHRRSKLLTDGKLKIVSYLSSRVPRTQHDFDSFTMDLNLVTEGFMLITVTGFFKEMNHKNTRAEFIRYFDRTFTIVPQGAGYCISNEQWHISNPSMQQEKKMKRPSTPGPATAVAAAPPPVGNNPTEEVKQQMVLALSQETNMNLTWSLRCLQEVQWNYDTARSAFNEAFGSGKIPADAFVK